MPEVETERPAPRKPYTARSRVRHTRRSVAWANRAAGVLIAVSGVGTILAVLLVCVFLVWMVVPLFAPSALVPAQSIDRPSGDTDRAPLHMGVDEYLNIGWRATPDGTFVSYRADSGESLASEQLFDDKVPTASSFSLRDGHVAFGFADGSIQLGTDDFTASFVGDDEVPGELRALKQGEVATYLGGTIERTPEGQLRLQKLSVELQEPVSTKSDAEVVLMDMSISSRGTIIATLHKDATLHVAQVTQSKNLLTGEITSRLREGMVDVELPDGEFPSRLMLAGLGDATFLVWQDGRVQRYDTRTSTRPAMAERFDLVEDPNEHVTALAFLIGKSSLVAGDSAGHVGVWFGTKPDDAETPDGSVFVKARELPAGPGPVVALGPSPRSRMLAIAYADGTVRLTHVTSSQQLAEVKSEPATTGIGALIISPKDDAVIASAGDKLVFWSIDAPHPEISLSSILRPVWYEGFSKPEHVWQSSSGTDDFEPKYGLYPLIFGTIKATFYSMLFGAPLALLAAIYTSEFLHPKAKARIKPTIEIMASLPSVVLGFLAALFFAPLVEDIIPQSLAIFVTVPFAYLLGAHLWQCLPAALAVKARRYRMLAMIAVLPLGIALAWWTGGLIEDWLFAGDIRAWLDGQIGTGTGAWMFILLPVAALTAVWAVNTFVTPAMRHWAGDWPRPRFALLDFGKFIGGCLATLLFAYAASYLLNTYA